jgi:mannose-6-phosphate isomerase-like protein (cupin superfamily)
MEQETTAMDEARRPVTLAPGEGRGYDMGRIQAVFKADGAETAGRYSISEWWLEPNTTGPGAHSHPEDDVFYVVDGTMTLLVGDRWIDAPKGAFVLVPGGMTHDFQNRGSERAGVLNFSAPGTFEQHMPAIVEWFTDNPASDAIA